MINFQEKMRIENEAKVYLQKLKKYKRFFDQTGDIKRYH